MTRPEGTLRFQNLGDAFNVATGHPPYGYQCRLACGDNADPHRPETLTTGRECSSTLIDIPTGLGKTPLVFALRLRRFYVSSTDSPAFR